MSDQTLEQLWSAPPELDASLFCRAFTHDVAGRLALLQIFHTLPGETAQDFVIVNFWRSEAPVQHDYTECVEMRNADGHCLDRLETTPFSLGGPVRRQTNFICCQGLVLPSGDTYEVWLSLLLLPDRREVARHLRLLEAT